MNPKHKRFFNTSGPCLPAENYTLKRSSLIDQGTELVKNKRYFTIWAPRQTGKSTYFLLLKTVLEKKNYRVVHINAENFGRIEEKVFFETIASFWRKDLAIEIKSRNFNTFYNEIREIPSNHKIVFIIDEIEGLNPELFSQFLHTIRNLYHFREEHCLKSVIFIGVSNILGVIQDNASPFNIADNLALPYFTAEEVSELLEMHEEETGQSFTSQVKEKIWDITAGQPGLVNAFAYELVRRNPDASELTLELYHQVEDWYLYEAIDKNIENIKNKASQYRALMEALIFKEDDINFDIDRESIKFLHAQGIIRRGSNNGVVFWVPLYKKRLYKYFSPDLNGEGRYFLKDEDPYSFYEEETETIKIVELIEMFKEYVAVRSFKYFMTRSEDGSYERLREAGAGYAFSTYIDSFVRKINGRIYYEADSGLGRTDMIICTGKREYVLEFKVFSDKGRYQRGKKQVAYYSLKRNLGDGYYVIFVPKRYNHLEYLKETREIVNGITVHTFIIWYDEDKDF